MPQGLGLQSGYGVAGGADALKELLATRFAEALKLRQQASVEEEQRQRGEQFKQQEADRQATAKRLEDAAQSASETADVNAIDKIASVAAPKQDVTDALLPFMQSKSPRVQAAVGSFEKNPNIWPQAGPVGIRQLNPKLPPNPPASKEPMRIGGVKPDPAGPYAKERSVTALLDPVTNKRIGELPESDTGRAAGTSTSENDPEVTDYWVKQIQNDPTQWDMVSGDKGLANQVRVGLSKAGVSLDKITSQSRAMSETAKEILPHITTVESEADQLDKLGLMGPIRSRWTDLIAGKVGAGDLVGGNSQNAQLIGKFITDVGLLKTAAARAHGGARGGGSPMMLEHMSTIMGMDKDFDTFMGNMAGVKDWMQGYAGMTAGSNVGSSQQPGGGQIARAGAVATGPKPPKNPVDGQQWMSPDGLLTWRSAFKEWRQ